MEHKLNRFHEPRCECPLCGTHMLDDPPDVYCEGCQLRVPAKSIEQYRDTHLSKAEICDMCAKNGFSLRKR